MEHHDDEFEREFWGDCVNTFDEEQKHYVYSRYMGIKQKHFSFELDTPSKVLDIGGGPVSIMTKTSNILSGSLVVDPLAECYPGWVHDRYATKNIKCIKMNGEDTNTLDTTFDEVWMYNVLQHTDDPKKIISNMLSLGNTVRVFEWIDIPPHEGHPHMLTEQFLNDNFGSKGGVVELGESGCFGRAWYNVIHKE